MDAPRDLSEAFESVRREYVKAFEAARTDAERAYLVAWFDSWLKEIAGRSKATTQYGDEQQHGQ